MKDRTIELQSIAKGVVYSADLLSGALAVAFLTLSVISQPLFQTSALMYHHISRSQAQLHVRMNGRA
jgi:hypothetical protein